MELCVDAAVVSDGRDGSPVPARADISATIPTVAVTVWWRSQASFYASLTGAVSGAATPLIIMINVVVVTMGSKIILNGLKGNNFIFQ